MKSFRAWTFPFLSFFFILSISLSFSFSVWRFPSHLHRTLKAMWEAETELLLFKRRKERRRKKIERKKKKRKNGKWNMTKEQRTHKGILHNLTQVRMKERDTNLLLDEEKMERRKKKEERRKKEGRRSLKLRLVFFFRSRLALLSLLHFSPLSFDVMTQGTSQPPAAAPTEKKLKPCCACPETKVPFSFSSDCSLRPLPFGFWLLRGGGARWRHRRFSLV